MRGAYFCDRVVSDRPPVVSAAVSGASENSLGLALCQTRRGGPLGVGAMDVSERSLLAGCVVGPGAAWLSLLGTLQLGQPISWEVVLVVWTGTAAGVMLGSPWYARWRARTG